ncbi:MAG: hypothetical protein ACT4QF_22420 [Sporichthyaceae bacterium]
MYEKVRCTGLSGEKTRTVMIAHHPCALRSDGVTLHERLVVHVVRDHPLVAREAWGGHVDKMPLPEIDPTTQSRRRHMAAIFEAPGFVDSAELDPARRIACLSPYGVNLLMQRWVHFASRLVVPTFDFDLVTSSAYTEVDLVEEWCAHRVEQGLTVAHAEVEAAEWLRGSTDNGKRRQDLLKDPQQRSTVRRAMRSALEAI